MEIVIRIDGEDWETLTSHDGVAWYSSDPDENEPVAWDDLGKELQDGFSECH